MKAQKVVSYLRAGFSLFWMKTFEPNRIRETIYELIESYQRKDGNKYKVLEWTMTKEANPMKSLIGLTDAPDFTILFVHNFHWFAEKPQIVQYIQDNLPIWSATGKALVAISPVDKIPVELSKDYVLMELSLPDEEEILSAIDLVKPDDFEVHDSNRIVNACKGLTRAELESTLSLSFVETDGDHFSIPTINDYKAQAINKSGFLSVLQPDVNFTDIIGYTVVKQMILETIDNPKAKGIIAVGPPGTGKTTLMKAIVAETGKFGLAVMTGKMYSKFQGETDANVSAAIDLISSVGPCLVLIDEFEKQFAGVGGSGETDGGVSKRASSQWLDFLQNRPEGVYIVATANSFVGIPPEYLRPGRWDSSPFFIDLPSNKVKQNILKHYCKKAGIKPPTKTWPTMEDYSGAEIEALVHIASMRNISLFDAAECIIATAKTNADQINALRKWAKDSTVSAEKIPGLKVVNGKRKMDV